MPKKSDDKLPRAIVRQAKKVATGPLLGPIEPAPTPPVEPAKTTIAYLGTLESVRKRIEAVTEPEG